MIDPKIAMAILGALPQDKLLKALEVAGIAPAASMGVGMNSPAMSMGSEQNKIEPWSSRQVAYDGGKDRPSLIDRMWAKPQMNAMQPVAGGNLVAHEDPYLQTGG